jgi:glyoxylase-like metal-dependent hydrolase (beta-lactamase superfamily II)
MSEQDQRDDVLRLDLGGATITLIVEQPLFGLNSLIALAKPEAIRDIDWLVPAFADADGTLRGLVQAMVVEHGDSTIVVDTCVGDGKDLPAEPDWCDLTTGFLDRFAAAGFDPLEVDHVLCTHLHLDHVGWNTRLDGARWVPTFPNARYVFAQVEYDHWAAEAASYDPDLVPTDDRHARMLRFQLTQANVFTESLQPLVDADLVDLVSPPHELVPGVRLVPTPGHTPGHVSVEVTGADRSAIITGDSFHHPCQVARPEWSTRVDSDRERSSVTRRQLLDEIAGSDTWLIGSHFARPTAGRVVRSGESFRLIEM